MTTTYSKGYQSKELLYNILNKYYICFRIDIWNVFTLGDDLKIGIFIENYGDTHYFQISNKRD